MGRRLIAVCMCLVLFADPARAETLRVGTAGDYKPLTWYDARTGTFSGTDIDLIRAFGADEKRAVTFVKTTWPRLMADLLAGRFDAAIGGISRTPQRSRQALLSGTIGRSGKVALVRCGEEDRYGSLAAIDRAAVKVVENRGGTNEKIRARPYRARCSDHRSRQPTALRLSGDRPCGRHVHGLDRGRRTAADERRGAVCGASGRALYP